MSAAPETADAEAPTLLREAMAEHSAGRLDAAEALYRRRLDDAPDDADALHLRGVLLAQRGRHAEAAASIEGAIARQPGEAMFHNNLGNVRIELGDLDAAESGYRRAIELDGSRLDAANNLGVLLSRRGRAAEAEALLLQVLDASPGFTDARQNLANHYLRVGNLPDAVQQCCDGMITAPRSVALRRVLGAAYGLMGRHDQEIEVYRRWLEDDPGSAVAAYHLRACTGEDVPARAPDEYVTHVFDSFAKSFDAKLAALSYRAPEFVQGGVRRRCGDPRQALEVLDAGCGTGLCGPLLAPWARRLAGVDLSEGMLAQAVGRRVYDELVAGELVEYLGLRAAAWDLIVSADTLCYFGALEAFASAARAALRAGGELVFTVEAHADVDGAAGYRLHTHGRYSHRRRYVQRTLEAAGFDAVETDPVVLRMEAGEPVQGWLVAARAR
jgi:predicted TPR repeat methyltransferase